MTTTSIKKKRVSKKTKQSWRKHVDIKDVDDFLDDQRLEERLGGSFTLRGDDELFVVDVEPKEAPVLTEKQKKRLELQNAPLKCFSHLESTSKVPDPISKRNRVRTPEERRNPISKRLDQERRQRGIYKKKDIISADTRQRALKKKIADQVVFGEVKSDVWSVEAAENDTPDSPLYSEWVTKEQVLHTLKNTGKIRKIVPKRITQKTSVIKAVEAPHPGTSYNPSFKDHQDLLNIISEKELSLIKEEKHLNRVTSQLFSRVSPAQREKSWLTEMSEGLPNVEQVKKVKPQYYAFDSSDSESDGDYKTINPPVKNNKKDTKQKRKKKEQRILQHQLKKNRENKKKIADIYKLKFINKNIENTDKKIEKLQEIRKKVTDRKSVETKVLGPVKYEDPELDFNFTSDLSGNLRNIKTAGHVLKDRFKSLQKRNVIEPRVHQGLKKRSKVKKFTRSSHKD